MSDEFHTDAEGYPRKLGCLPPKVFPTGFRTLGESESPVMSLDRIREVVAGRRGIYDRRSVFDSGWVGDQHSTGACNGWACARALSRTSFLRSGVRVLLSGADAYSQMNGGVDQGSQLADGMKVIQANGVATEAAVPWNLIYDRQIPAAARAERARFKGFELYAVDTQEELASGLVYGFVAVVAVHVAGGFDQQDGDGVCRGGNGPGNHAVGLDDVGVLPSGELVFDMFNSWGTGWGTNGRTRLAWDRHFRESVKYHRFFLVRSAKDDPQGENPPAAS